MSKALSSELSYMQTSLVFFIFLFWGVGWGWGGGGVGGGLGGGGRLGRREVGGA